MSYTVSFINQKGGVGKTTTLVQLASLLAQESKKVLVVDLDGQANATSRILGQIQPTRPHMFDLLIDEEFSINPAKAIYPAKGDFKGVYVIAADKRLATAEPFITNRYNRETILQKILKPIRGNFDFVLIDNPPTLNLLTINSLVAASEMGGYLIPVDMSMDAAGGAKAVQQTIQIMKKNGMTAEPDFIGVLICQFQKANARAMRDMVEHLSNTYGRKLLSIKVPHTSKVIEANNQNRAVSSLDFDNSASVAYRALSKIVLSMQQ